MRPLPPFKLKPIRVNHVRRVVSAETIQELAGELPDSVKPARAALRIQQPIRKAALKVLGRADNDRT
jgi:hypothetical protein